MNTKKMVIAALMLALCMVLPFLTGQIPQFGSMMLPIHLPVLLCGFFCGPVLSLIVGALAPLLRFLLFGMPPIFPAGVAMMFELAAYGFFAALFYKKFGKGPKGVYISLIGAMIIGRIVWGIVRFIIAKFILGVDFGFELFLSGAIIGAWPGIILQLVLIPVIVLALEKSNLTSNE